MTAGLRRTMLTASSAPPLPAFGGNPALGTTPVASCYAAFSRFHYKATAAGTATLVTANFATGGSVAFFTMNPSGNVVRSVSPTVTATTGVATYPVSLTVAVGDVIGVWCSGGTAQIRSYFDGAIGVVDVTRDFSTVAKPTPGSTQVNSGAVADHSLALRAS